jgi:hypothetical protein
MLMSQRQHRQVTSSRAADESASGQRRLRQRAAQGTNTADGAHLGFPFVSAAAK